MNLATGVATAIGFTGVQLGSLQFGPDGLLYAGGTGVSAGNIYRITIPSGTPTLVGNYGLGGGVTGLTLRTSTGISSGPIPGNPDLVPDVADPGDGFFENVKTRPLTTSETILVPWALHVEEDVTNVAGIIFRMHYDSNELDLLHTWGGTLNFFNTLINTTPFFGPTVMSIFPGGLPPNSVIPLSSTFPPLPPQFHRFLQQLAHARRLAVAVFCDGVRNYHFRD